MRDFSDILILTDLDGTFFGDHATVVPRNVEAIERFKAAGGFFSISTGRVHTGLEKNIPGIGTLVNAPMACCNGAQLYDVRIRKTLEEKPMDPARSTALLRYLSEKYADAFYRISVPEGMLVTPDSAARSERLQLEMRNSSSFIIRDWDGLSDYTWYKIVFRGDSDLLDVMRKDAIRAGFGEMTFSKSAPTFFEVQGPGVNKGAMIPSLKAYCKAVSGKDVRVYACGDYENDIPMLRTADVSVCPANAIDSVKEMADMCLCGNNEGLIADLIERLEKE